MSIKKLDPDIITQLRSNYVINSVVQCVTELVLNSLDAKSKAIAVRVNLVTFRIQVVDNGEGISKNNLKLVGLRYMTSKNDKKYYGFRGESLSSICCMSKTVSITSRQDSEETYVKNIKHNKDGGVVLTNERPSRGTTVTVEGFLNNLPVRRRNIKADLELEEVRNSLTALIIINPSVSFTLRNDITGDLILNSVKHKDVIHSFLSVYSDVTDDLQILKIKKDKIVVEGLIHKELCKSKKMQYIYVNKRPVINTELQLYVNNLLKNMDKSKKNREKSPIFVINIKCPYSEVDMITNHSKTVVEFKNWSLITKCMEKLANVFLGKEQEEKQNNKPASLKCKSQFSVSNIKGAVKGKAFKRKAYEEFNLIDDVFEMMQEKSPEVLNKINVQRDQEVLEKSQDLDEVSLEEPEEQFLNENSKNMHEICEIREPQIKNYIKNPKHEEFYEHKGPQRDFDRYVTKNNNKNPENDIKRQKLYEKIVPDSHLERYVTRNYNKNPENGIKRQNVPECHFDRNINKNTEILLVQKPKTKNHFPKPQNKKLKLTNETENDYFINFTDENENQNKKLAKNTFKNPLPIKINPPEDFQNMTMFSKFTTDENKGKNIIMDMFLKSTQVFQKNDSINKDDSQNESEKSRETILESNIFMEQTLKTKNKAKNTTMSMSVKIKKKRTHQKNDMAVQTSFDKKMVSECIQTTFNNMNKTNNNFYINKTVDVDNYTIVLPKTNKNLPEQENLSIFNYQIEPFDFIGTEVRKKQKIDLLEMCRKYNTKRVPQGTIFSPIKQVNKNRKPNLSLMNITSSFSRKYRSEETPFNKQIEIFPRSFSEDYTFTRDFQPKLFSTQKDHSFNFIKPFEEKCSPEKYQPKLFSTRKNVSFDFVDQKICSPEKCNIFNENIETSMYFETCKFDNFKPKLFSTQANTSFYFAKPKISKNFTLTENFDFLNDTVNKFTNEELILHQIQEPNIWFKETNLDGNICYINKRTGLALANSQNRIENNVFNMNQRPEFVPKGLSPIMQIKNDEVDKSLSQNAKEKLQQALVEKLDDLNLLKWQKYLDNYQDPKTFFDELYQEKTKLYENNIKVASFIPKHLKAVNFKVFKKDIFKSLMVIGQIDNKFIAALDNKEKLLIIFDQHAVHERIHLENLQKEYHGKKVDCPQTTLFVRKLDINILKENEEYLNYIGITTTFLANCINVTQIPLCLHNKILNEKTKNCHNKFITILIQELIETFKENKGVAPTMPVFLQDLINMEACRGAIKFGDPLNIEECQKLILDLTNCDLPFQCAHGRPTLTPLINLFKGGGKKKGIRFHVLKK